MCSGCRRRGRNGCAAAEVTRVGTDQAGVVAALIIELNDFGRAGFARGFRRWADGETTLDLADPVTSASESVAQSRQNIYEAYLSMKPESSSAPDDIDELIWQETLLRAVPWTDARKDQLEQAELARVLRKFRSEAEMPPLEDAFEAGLADLASSLPPDDHEPYRRGLTEAVRFMARGRRTESAAFAALQQAMTVMRDANVTPLDDRERFRSFKSDVDTAALRWSTSFSQS